MTESFVPPKGPRICYAAVFSSANCAFFTKSSSIILACNSTFRLMLPYPSKAISRLGFAVSNGFPMLILGLMAYIAAKSFASLYNLSISMSLRRMASYKAWRSSVTTYT